MSGYVVAQKSLLISDYLNQEIEKNGPNKFILAIFKTLLRYKLTSSLMFPLSIGTLNFTATRKIKFLSEYVPQKPHVKQPKLSKAERFLIISFSLHSSCLILSVLP